MTKYYILTGYSYTGQEHENLFSDYDKENVEFERGEYVNHPGNSSEYSKLNVHTLEDDKQETIDALMSILNPQPEPLKLRYNTDGAVYCFTIQEDKGDVFVHSHTERNGTKECFLTEQAESISKARQAITDSMAFQGAKRLHNI